LARPWSSSRLGLHRLGLHCLGLLLLVPLLTSCLDLGVNVEFKTSTSGQVRITALGSRLAQGLNQVEGADRVVFPTTRAEWQLVAEQVSALAQAGTIPPAAGVAATGLSLVSWEGADEDQGFRSTTVLAFTNARALEGLFVVFKQKLTLLQDTQGTWTLKVQPQVPRLTGGDPESRRLWTSLWGSTQWRFSFLPPGGSRIDKTVALADLAGTQAPEEWTLTW